MILTFILWQRLCSLLIIISLLFVIKPMFFIMLLFKIGLPPFHMWVWFNQSKWRINSFIIFVTSHKFLPIILIVNHIKINWWIISFLWFGLIQLWGLSRMKSLIFGSRIIERSWIILRWFRSLKIFVFYLILIIIILLIWLNLTNLRIYNSKIRLILVCFLLLRQPPLFRFIIKWTIIGRIKIFISLIITILSWFRIIFYWFWFSFILVFKNFINFKINKIIILLIIFNIAWLF